MKSSNTYIIVGVVAFIAIAFLGIRAIRRSDDETESTTANNLGYNIFSLGNNGFNTNKPANMSSEEWIRKRTQQGWAFNTKLF